MIIYKIENKINGKAYIGQTIGTLNGRISAHSSGGNRLIQRAITKYGIQSFDISIIDVADDRNVLLAKEKYWIKAYDCKAPCGYNLTDGGDGVINLVEESRQKMRGAWTPERKKEHSERFTGDGNPMKNPETVEKVRVANTGHKATDETRLKMEASASHEPKSETHRANISNALMGHEVTDEVREALREYKTGSKDSPETIEKKRQGSMGHIVGEAACLRMSKDRLGVPRTEEAKQNMRHPNSEAGRLAKAESNRKRKEARAVTKKQQELEGSLTLQ